MALLAACACFTSASWAQPVQPASPAATGPSWSALTPAQKSALAPLKNDWPSIDAPRKQKWLEIAGRFASMPAEEQQRIQQRMSEWARMTPEQRGQARLQFQEARQLSPQQRQARWDAYLALPVEERRALAERARTVPKADTAGRQTPAVAAEPRVPASSVRLPAQATAKVVAPTVVQARPGASTTLITTAAAPPPHAQAGQPKIAPAKSQAQRAAAPTRPSSGVEPQGSDAAASAAQ